MAYVMERRSALAFDSVVAGAGIIGLSVALELHTRGMQVLVLDRGEAYRQASFAAAGMLAVVDIHNPPPLHPLSRLSESLYPPFLARLRPLSGIDVPFQTTSTVHHLENGDTEHLEEGSVDPRQLGVALLAAVRAAGIPLREHTELTDIVDDSGELVAVLSSGERIPARSVVLATGAWSVPPALRQREDLLAPKAVKPVKGQMLRVALPASLAGLDQVHRRGACYAVPRTAGPNTGTAVLGTTVEFTGYETSVHASDLAALRTRVAELVPELADETTAPALESWAGLRPMTPDGLPILGESSHPGIFFAFGHGRNGIQLAPGTAAVVADLVQRKAPPLDLAAFSPERFAPVPAAE